MRREGLAPYPNISPSRDSWLSASTGVSSHLTFNRREARVDPYIGRTTTQANKCLFDQLHLRKAEIEAMVGAPLNWQRLDSGQASRVGFAQGSDCYGSEHWQEIIAWMVKLFRRFDAAFRGPLQVLAPELRPGRFGTTG